MQTRILAYRAQMHIFSHLGRVVEMPDYCFVESPADPDWFWGTFLVMQNAPVGGDKALWEKIWDTHLPDFRHRSFCWDQNDGFAGELKEFLDAEYERFDSVTMISREVPLCETPEGIEIRPLVSDADWAALAELQSLVDAEKYEGGRRGYKTAQMQNYRRLVQAGRGEWWGAFAGGELASDMGLFDGGSNRMSLQLVETHPAFRRRGICSALTAALVRRGALSGKEIMVVAQADHPAQELYEKLGFRIAERTVEISAAK